MLRYNIVDAQQALGFLVNQASFIEQEVYRQQFPEIQYPGLVPVDNSAPDWVKSITFFSLSQAGQADWFHHMATDMRVADIQRSRNEVGVEMAGIGYYYTLEEIQQAILLNVALTSERGSAAVRAYEEFTENIAFVGSTDKDWTGLINNASVTRVDAPIGAGVGGDTEWTTKTGDEIVKDINDALTAVYTGSNTVEMANTVLLPVDRFTLLSTKRLDVNLPMTIMEWVQRFNVYTQQTGQPLVIRAVRRLSTAGNGGTMRMVVYRRDPSIVKMHIPMPHRFLPVWQTGPIRFDVPGIFRIAGVEIRRPAAFRYVDLI
jgi:hypothetical protein